MTTLRIEQALSPYYTNTTITPRYIILHCIGYNDPLQVLAQNQVSCHYLIPQQSNATNLLVYEVVQPPLRAWHAGVSQWQDARNLNDWALGIEINMPNYARALENKTLDYLFFQPYQLPQIDALKILVKKLMQEYRIPPSNVIGHSDIAPWRVNNNETVLAKTDPGPTLPWRELAKDGIGVWPKPDCPFIKKDVSAATAQRLLRKIGYNVSASGIFDKQTNLTVGAARLHWQPSCYDNTTQLATECYRRPFDQDLACSLYNVGEGRYQPTNNQPSIFTTSSFIAVAATGGILLFVLLALYVYVTFFRKGNSRSEERENESTQRLGVL